MPPATPLGRLQRVALREVWEDEGVHFTPWLARAENMELLANALRLELEVEAQEKSVGPFRADILCRDTATEKWVLIENQLERTDHLHLGQLLTYAAGLDAVVLVWIAERFTDEHRAALDWLNELGNERLRCFGLEIELWRIGDSAIAPKFNVVSEPNDWSRSVAAAADQVASEALSDAKRLQLEYWHQFGATLRASDSVLRPTKAAPQSWMNLALGRSGFRLAAVASTYSSETGSYSDQGEIRAEVCFDHPDNAKAAFAQMQTDKAAIERELGAPLVWDGAEHKRSCKAYLRLVTDVRDKANWEGQHVWLRTQLEALHRVFAPRIKRWDAG